MANQINIPDSAPTSPLRDIDGIVNNLSLDDGSVLHTQALSGITIPAPHPLRPELYDEVEWGPLPTDKEYEQAYKAWKLAYDTLRPPEPVPDRAYPLTDIQVEEEVLVEYVLGYFRGRNAGSPLDPPNPRSQERPGGPPFDWAAQDFMIDDEPVENVQSENEPILINGVDVMLLKVKDLLVALGRDTKWQNQNRYKKADLLEMVKRMKTDERQQADAERRGSAPQVLRRSRLERWGINRTEGTKEKHPRDRRYSALDLYTLAIHWSPYNPTYWTARAYLFFQQGRYDLALGDGYRAHMLTDTITTVFNRAKRPGLYPRLVDALERHLTVAARTNPPLKRLQTKSQGVPTFTAALSKAYHHIISMSLWACNAFYDYDAFDKRLTDRLIMNRLDHDSFARRYNSFSRCHAQQQIERNRRANLGANVGRSFWHHERDVGFIEASPFPQSGDPIDRLSATFVQTLNDEYIQGWEGDDSKYWLRVEVLSVDRGGVSTPRELCVVANQNIPKDTIVYADEPSVRGHLEKLLTPSEMAEKLTVVDEGAIVEVQDYMPYERGTPGPRKLRCENCKRVIPWKEVHEARQQYLEAKNSGRNPEHCPCIFADPIRFFCTEKHDEAVAPRLSKTKKKRKTAQETVDLPSCMAIARSLYHGKACGRSWRWLHEACRENKFRNVEDIDESDYECQGNILGLLFREVVDMTLMKREQEQRKGDDGDFHILAHEIEAMVPLLGGDKLDDAASGRKFPFSWAANIAVPFDILETMGVNIFKDLAFDTWVIQTVLQKLAVNAVAWDKERRNMVDISQTPENVEGMPQPPANRPQFCNLYVHTGFSLFNHACADSNNASWGWMFDPKDEYAPANKILVKADRDIRQGEEVTVKYSPASYTAIRRATRIFGGPCHCLHHQ
ncbi:MAG: hypothetical protein M1825_004726 [Sarcosagium campestre]|nr:MAG: hypothetical protein M1825_004726 [Sarcosagium campestre]